MTTEKGSGQRGITGDNRGGRRVEGGMAGILGIAS